MLREEQSCSGPGRSDVDLFRDGESVIDLNAEVAHGALDLLVPQQRLYCS